MTIPCGCCEGIERLTPATIVNPPGLGALAYRAGTHASFLATMMARLSTLSLEVPLPELDERGAPKTQRIYPLQALSTRQASDPAIALLDAWATVADVLTFYGERIANEGYLRTATERRSILELARLIGYALRPGVASTVYLAYTLDEDRLVTPPKPIHVPIPVGTRAQSVPGPGELPQSFETAETFEAHSAWNNLKPRLTQPQTEDTIRDRNHPSPAPRIYLQGISTNLKTNDPLLVDFGAGTAEPFRVTDVIPDAAANRTLVMLREWVPVAAPPPGPAPGAGGGGLVASLLKPPSLPPASSARLARSVGTTFAEKSDAGVQLLASVQPALRDALPTALANSPVTPASGIKAYALRVTAAPFGDNAPKRTRALRGEITVIGEWPIVEWPPGQEGVTTPFPPREKAPVIDLAGSFDKIMADAPSRRSFIVVDTSAWFSDSADLPPQVAPASPGKPLVTTIGDVKADVSRADYGVTGKITRITLNDRWLTLKVPDLRPKRLQETYDVDFRVLRSATVYAQSEELILAEEPIDTDVCGGQAAPIELDDLYSELQPGQWLIVSGERTDIRTDAGAVVPGVRASELVMLAGVTQDVKKIPAGEGESTELPGDRTHTFIQLAADLAYCYKRDTTTVYGNVVKATHGETRNEVLGNGDASKALPQFALRQPPLTFVSAPTPAGAQSTLEVRVNEVRWHEAASLDGLGPTDRNFITRTDDDAKTTMIFGTGQHGARVPTGQGNVKAVYRNGLGKPGNVKAEQISQLATRPLGVKAVTNPIRASGGADKESRDQARQNVPLAVMALDRLVATQDYADFARTFAGIGKAAAARLSNGRRQLVHVTIAGADDIPIERTSDLYRNLVTALRDFGDPSLPIQVAVRELLALVISANVRVLPDYRWESVEADIRAALIDAFGFGRRDLGQTVFLSEVISAIQRVAGVAYVDVDLLDSISEVELSNPELLKQKLAALLATKAPAPHVLVQMAETMARAGARPASAAIDGVYPAQLALMASDVPATLILNEVTR